MMKYPRLTAFFALLMLLPSQGLADRVPEEKARQLAENFLRMKPISVTTPLTRGHEAPEFYIYSAPLARSFVIISGEDTVQPILAYSRESAFPERDLPRNLEWWLEEIARGIDHFRKQGTKQSAAMAALWTPTRALSVEPKVVLELETAKWDQREPYNLLCPVIDGKNTLTGCLATSFAIILRYHKWPDKGEGIAKGYRYDGGTVPDLVLGHEYDWENMPLVYDHSTPEQNAAVSRLMYDLCVLSEAEFGLEGTPGYNVPAMIGIQDHMEYSKNAKIYSYDFFSHETWIEMIQRELREVGPVSYTGQSNTDGHAFVIDGYDDHDNFHINWGWGGLSDGYFTIPDFGIYSSDHVAIFGIKKDEGVKPQEAVLLLDYGIWNWYDEPMVQGRTISTAIASVYSVDTETVQGLVSFGVADKNYKLKELLGEPFEVNLSQYGSSEFLMQTCSIQGDITHGDRLMVFFKGDRSGEWVPLFNYWGGRGSARQKSVIYEIPLSNPDLMEEASLSFNVESNLLTIKLPQEVTWTLTLKGQEVKSGKSDQLEATISLAGLENGEYVLTLLGETGAKSSVTLTL